MRYLFIIISFNLLITGTDMQSQTLDQQVNLFTIPNMSTSFVRMPSRESSQEIDAVFFNPAGLTSLEDGFHFQLNNQFQFIRKGLTTEYESFNMDETYYDFSLNNYTFPTIFAAWKRQNLTFSVGIFAAIGGGGGASFDNLPSAELGISDMNNILSGILSIYDDYYNFEDSYSDIFYQYDFVSKGLAFSPGVQLCASYKINNNWSAAAGMRYVTYFSNAEGSAVNIEVNNASLDVAEDPAGYIRFMQEREYDVISERTIDVGPIHIDGNELLDLLSGAFEELVPETVIDVRQKGRGFTPIIGLQYNWNNKLYAAFKYEHRTKIELTNEVFDSKDGDGLYEDGKVYRADLPGFFSLGLRYRVNDKLTLASGHRTVMFKRADWNGRNQYIDRNFLEFTISGEYAVHPRFIISGGYTFSETKVENEYQNEVDYVMPGHTFAVGAKWNITDNVAIEGGMINVIYTKQSFDKQYEPFQGRLNLPEFFDQTVHNEVDGRVMLVSIGASISMPSTAQ
ncbi:MAG: hypothetical protein GY751_07885 [Bacteroidetes bacterium]|nr:hypothetical protein [Bacteroidota bacterium]